MIGPLLVCSPRSAPIVYPTIEQSAFVSDFGNNCGSSESISFGVTPANGKLILLFISEKDGVPTTSISGFNLLAGNNAGLSVFWKIAASESNSYAYTYGGAGALTSATMMRGLVIGGNFTSPIDVSANTVNSDTSPSITTTNVGELIITAGASHSATTAFATAPAGTTLAYHDTVTTLIGFGIATTNKATAGVTGGLQWNASTYTVANAITIGVRSQ